MKLKKGSLSYLVLLSLEMASQASVGLENLSYSAQMRALKGIPINTSTKSLSETLRRLKKKKAIEYQQNQDGELLLKLTNFGLETINSMKGHVWDGKYRIVIWDIPESKRNVRDLLRRRLKEWGFKNWQRSVWVSKRNVTYQLRKLISDLGIERWVAVIESEDDSLNKLFA